MGNGPAPASIGSAELPAAAPSGWGWRNSRHLGQPVQLPDAGIVLPPELVDQDGFERSARQASGDRQTAIGQYPAVVRMDVALDAHVRPPALAIVVNKLDGVEAGLHKK